MREKISQAVSSYHKHRVTFTVYGRNEFTNEYWPLIYFLMTFIIKAEFFRKEEFQEKLRRFAAITGSYFVRLPSSMDVDVSVKKAGKLANPLA